MSEAREKKRERNIYRVGNCKLDVNEYVHIWASTEYYERKPLKNGDGIMFRQFINDYYKQHPIWLRKFAQAVYRQKLALSDEQKQDLENLNKLSALVERLIIKSDKKLKS